MKNKYLIMATAAALYLMSSAKGSAKSFANITSFGKIRGCDIHGCGNFGATRGNHIHQGEDYLAAPNDAIFSPISGKVMRVAYPYAGNTAYKGLEIKNDKYTVKLFYISPTVAVGAQVLAGQKIATAQNIAAKYSAGMANHVHVEVRDLSGNLLKLSDLV